MTGSGPLKRKRTSPLHFLNSSLITSGAMPLFVNRDQIFAHQVHLLEHTLRAKEERILELETENAILHLRLAESLGKLRQEREEETKALVLQQHLERKITHSAISKLLSEVQTVKQCLSEVFAVYVSFAAELEEKSKQLLEKVQQTSPPVNVSPADQVQDQADGFSVSLLCSDLQAQVAALERSLEEERETCRAERQRRKQLHNTLVELRGNIRVHCRVRPLLSFDGPPSPPSGSGPVPTEQVISAVSDDSVMVNCTKTGVSVPNKTFEFERVHGPEDPQETVFEEVKPLLTSLLDGYNVCIMAYGQTGSGKTYTMLGSQQQGEPQQGVVSMAAAEVFQLIAERPTASYTVEVSVMEVYNNEVFDLLATDEQGNGISQRRDVITTSAGASQVNGLTYEPVSHASEMMQIINSVLKLRTHCPTLVHTDSSRSHLIVTLSISSRSPSALALARRLRSTKDVHRSARNEWWSPHCRRANAAPGHSSDELIASPSSSPCPSPSPSPSSSPSPRQSISQAAFRTKLQLVDLAGSECVSMTGVSGAALWEVSCINRSLSALSDVLGALAEQRAHVPYRNSKLTHLLQDAIGGDAKLLVMLCVSPTQRFITESLQSLAFGTRARQVQRDQPRRKSNTLRVK